MTRILRRTSVVVAALVVAIAAAACGQQKIYIPNASSDASYKTDFASAQLFHERCGGCHTLSYAATSGSGNNPRTYLDISGPNFNVRCERPVARVLYAIENGGFGGAYMPANIVVGQQARNLAEFVSKFAGSKAPVEPDTTPCAQQAIGSLPTTNTGGVTIGSGVTSTSTTASGSTAAGTGTSASTSTAASTASPIAAGKSVFVENCGGCHILADAGTAGNEGPNLDNLKPSEATVMHQVINGGGAMPAFGKTGLLTSTQVTDVAKYVSSVAGKK